MRILSGLIGIIILGLSIHQFKELSANGISGISVMTTIWLWSFISFLIILLVLGLSKILKVNRERRNNFILSVCLMGMGLLSLDILLRYGFKYNLTYNESNGDFYYESFHREDYERFYVYAPNSTTEYITDEFSYFRKTNSLGIIEREISVEKEKGEIRILCLGDSFTEGIGAVEDKNSYPRQLEKMLIDKYGKRVTVINAGIAGSDPVFQYILLKEMFLKYHPDLVIVATNSVDLEEIMVRGGLERFSDKNLLKQTKAPKWEYLYAASFLVRFYVHNVLGMNYLFLDPEDDLREREQATLRMQETFVAFDLLTKEVQAKFLLVVHPGSGWEVADGHYVTADFAQKILPKQKINTLDLLEYYLGERKMNTKNFLNYYWKNDLHHNDKGYAEFARAVYDKIEREYLIPIEPSKK